MRFSLLIALAYCLQLPAALGNFQEMGETPPDTVRTADYQLGPGDQLNVRVMGLDQLSKTVRISNSGKIHLPHLGILSVTDMTVPELTASIREELQKKGLVRDPQVQVLIAQYRARPVYIIGEVGLPGQYLTTGRLHVMDLITMAGGVNDVAQRTGYLYRQKSRSPRQSPPAGETEQSANEQFRIIPIDLKSLLEGGRLDLDLELQAGDILYVPQRKTEFFFVVGDVGKAGSFEIPEGKKLLVSQALAQAGGPTRTAKMSKGMLVRYNASGSRQELKVDFAAILQGRQPDFPVRPNDIIFIPGSAVKTLGYGLLGIIPTVTQNAIVTAPRGH